MGVAGTCDGDGVGLPLHSSPHETHHFCKSDIALQTLRATPLYSHGAAGHSCPCTTGNAPHHSTQSYYTIPVSDP